MNHITCMLLLCAATAWMAPAGNAPESDAATYKAYLQSDNNKAIAAYTAVVVQRTADYKQHAGDTQKGYALALAQYGLLNATMRTRDEKLFDQYADDTERLLEKLAASNRTWAEPRALLSAVYGLKMAYSPMKGVTLGAQSNRLMQQALKDNPKSALVWKLYGNAKFFTPATWGGDLDEATSAYQKAIALFEADKTNTADNWFYIDTLAYLGQACEKNGDKAAAVAAYNKALQHEPSFGWVQHVLLPKAQQP